MSGGRSGAVEKLHKWGGVERAPRGVGSLLIDRFWVGEEGELAAGLERELDD